MTLIIVNCDGRAGEHNLSPANCDVTGDWDVHNIAKEINRGFYIYQEYDKVLSIQVNWDGKSAKLVFQKELFFPKQDSLPPAIEIPEMFKKQKEFSFTENYCHAETINNNYFAENSTITINNNNNEVRIFAYLHFFLF